MKAAAFNKLIAEAYTTPEKTVIVYARLLKEAGLITTGARGRNAPEMTPLDAARLTLAILTTESPSQCVERVKRFGKIKYSPNFKKAYRGYETIQPDHFASLFKGETLEEVLAYMFGLPATVGIEESCRWFENNVFHLRVSDFDVLAELFQWKMEGPEIVGELMVPFKGEEMVHTDGGFQHVESFTPIKGGVRTERSISGISFLEIGLGLLPDEEKAGGA
ncbi:MAG: hypothetical protein HLUCCO07_01700 [Rhodobacteraceae bacterium HLUCCO07]|nr:MAG: hypothetical protein HLUCCO07_01700 [Rhodobacteraceae bacterium HLUCCO07]